jgi:hypothetical protein
VGFKGGLPFLLSFFLFTAILRHMIRNHGLVGEKQEAVVKSSNCQIVTSCCLMMGKESEEASDMKMKPPDPCFYSQSVSTAVLARGGYVLSKITETGPET